MIDAVKRDHDSFVDLCARAEGQFKQAGCLPVDPRCSADPYFPYDDEGYDEAWCERDDWTEFAGMEEAFDGMWNQQESPEEPVPRAGQNEYFNYI